MDDTNGALEGQGVEKARPPLFVANRVQPANLENRRGNR